MMLAAWGVSPKQSTRSVPRCSGMSRPSGTWCFRERDVFIRDSDAFYTWQFYKDTRDTILAYTVEITGMEGDAIKGNLYTQDYRAMAEHIERTALPAASVTVQFEGQSEPMEFRYAYYHEHKLSLHAQFGKAEKFRLEPLFRAAARDSGKRTGIPA